MTNDEALKILDSGWRSGEVSEAIKRAVRVLEDEQDARCEDLTYLGAIPGDGESVVRIYNREGDHVLSLLPCGVDENGQTTCVDLATPDGKVLFCGVRLSLAAVFAEHLGIEKIDDKE
jgi:hypothetical protein